MLLLMLRRRVGTVAAKLVVALDLLLRKNRACLEVCSQVNGAELALEGRDATHAGMNIGRADRALPELALKGPFFLEDHEAQALRLMRHIVKQPLYRLDLVGPQVQPALSHCIEHVPGPRIAVQ